MSHPDEMAEGVRQARQRRAERRAKIRRKALLTLLTELADEHGSWLLECYQPKRTQEHTGIGMLELHFTPDCYGTVSVLCRPMEPDADDPNWRPESYWTHGFGAKSFDSFEEALEAAEDNAEPATEEAERPATRPPASSLFRDTDTNTDTELED
jgi:hypothetical protein